MRGSALWMAAPALVVLVVLYIAPLAHLIPTSLQEDGAFSLAAYKQVLATNYGLRLLWNSLRLGIITTIITLLIGYPAAFGLALSRGWLRSLFLASLFLPLAASVIAKAFAWTILLRSHGVLNETLMALHITSQPIRLIFTQFALIAGAANVFLPFMILPIYGSVERVDPSLVEAALDLGAGPVRTMATVVLPLTAPGIAAGVLLVFVPAVGMYAVSTLLGGGNPQMIGDVINDQYGPANDQPLGAALGVTLLAAFGLVLLATGVRRRGQR